uniref:Uncharacterized protein n=1 Tax=Anopheles atroparvus TaxID=41427 RepID=A0A182IZX8_ANOAO
MRNQSGATRINLRATLQIWFYVIDVVQPVEVASVAWTKTYCRVRRNVRLPGSIHLLPIRVGLLFGHTGIIIMTGVGSPGTITIIAIATYVSFKVVSTLPAATTNATTAIQIANADDAIEVFCSIFTKQPGRLRLTSGKLNIIRSNRKPSVSVANSQLFRGYTGPLKQLSKQASERFDSITL